jgi:hypothetical protein
MMTMSRTVHWGFLCLLSLGAAPVAVQAQVIQHHHHDACCPSCHLAPAQCVCAVPKVTYRPVVETHMVPQPVLSHRNVTETRYRTEPVTETVPTTAYDCVTVDEGSYQRVWVPKIVTRQVPKTVYQQRTTYRTVPYQVTRQVAECRTQMVPRQTVRYVPETSTTMVYSGPTGVLSAAPTPIQSAARPVPDAHLSETLPTPITPRSTVKPEDSQEYDPAPRTSSAADLEFRQADRGTSKFVPAPSAATVWRTPRGTTTR